MKLLSPKFLRSSLHQHLFSIVSETRTYSQEYDEPCFPLIVGEILEILFLFKCTASERLISFISHTDSLRGKCDEGVSNGRECFKDREHTRAYYVSSTYDWYGTLCFFTKPHYLNYVYVIQPTTCNKHSATRECEYACVSWVNACSLRRRISRIAIFPIISRETGWFRRLTEKLDEREKERENKKKHRTLESVDRRKEQKRKWKRKKKQWYDAFLGGEIISIRGREGDADLLLGLTKGWFSRGWAIYENILATWKFSHREWMRGSWTKQKQKK